MEKKIALNLFIGTPCYNSMIHSDYLHSIISYQERKLPITIMTLGNESLVTRGRNTVISYFIMTNGLRTYCFWTQIFTFMLMSL